MLTGMLPDTVSIIGSTTQSGVMARLEAIPAGRNARDHSVGVAGPEPGMTHLGYLSPVIVAPDGTTVPVTLPADAYLTDQTGSVYVGLGLSRQARRRTGDVDHLEVPLRILADMVTSKRPASTLDSEGNPTGAFASVLNTVGAWGEANASDVEAANQRGQTVDSVLLLPTTADVKIGDQLTVRARASTAVSIEDGKFYQRVLLRQLAG